MLTVLGWAAGVPVDLAIEDGPIVVARRGCNAAINPRGFLRLPLAVRRRCGIDPGDRVLVAVHQRPQELLVIPMIAIDTMVDAYRRSHLDEAAR
jgi:hypothetical protein